MQKVSFNSHFHKLFFTPFGRQIPQLAGQISQRFSKCSEAVLRQSSERKRLWFETPVYAPSCSDLVAFQISVNDTHRFWCLHPGLIVPAANISYIILPVKAVCSYRIQGLVHGLNLTPRSIVTQGKSHLFIVQGRWEGWRPLGFLQLEDRCRLLRCKHNDTRDGTHWLVMELFRLRASEWSPECLHLFESKGSYRYHCWSQPKASSPTNDRWILMQK